MTDIFDALPSDPVLRRFCRHIRPLASCNSPLCQKELEDLRKPKDEILWGCGASIPLPSFPVYAPATPNTPDHDSLSSDSYLYCEMLEWVEGVLRISTSNSTKS